MTKHRDDFISWDEYFMAIAELNAMRSKDPQTQVGCVVVNNLNKIISSGYNGFPRGISNDDYPWERNSSDEFQNKYPYIVHAEMNAIVSSRDDLSGCDIYTTLFPCHQCTKVIIQAGIRHVYFGSNKYDGTPDNIAAKKMLTDVNITFSQKPPIKVKLIKNL
ncbi:deoxycytidylate deaminase [Spiroplasma sabaudiense Ar-1343]|uniref:Deoxycytidylate deaminase n=2 Tax=Spiroplasma sabaudiense TaxID=216944 RepID=W6AAW6_9MOLU|nr:deoxycytidylate deaminase [Spiroplasma sabaudiense Ar-1343]